MPTDRELVLQLLSGHEEAFEQLIGRHEAFIRYVLADRNWTPWHDLDDLLQKVLIKLWRNHFDALRHWNGLVEGPVAISLRPYLRTIARRVLLDRPPTREIQLDDGVDPPAAPPTYPAPGDAERVMTAAHRVCPNRDCQIVRLYYLDGVTVADIAPIFQLTELGVRSVLYRSLGRIRRELGLD